MSNHRPSRTPVAFLVAAVLITACSDDAPLPGGLDTAAARGERGRDAGLDQALRAVLASHRFTGRIERQVDRLRGRRANSHLVRAGQLLFFDPVTSLSGDNTCAGCHAPNASFADGHSITIGVDNNGIVGPSRVGPRNLRRSPTVLNTVLFPRLMLNSRFESLSGNPFDNSAGFLFPDPEGTSLSHLPHLMAAQAFMPVIDRIEMAGSFPGTRDEMRAEIARRVDAIPAYRRLLGRVFPDIRAGGSVEFVHIGQAIAEFQSTLVAANAPIDRFARGQPGAMTNDEKRGALLFFGEAGCVECHAVDVPFASGDEMFTDYREHVIGVPQIVPDVTNADFDGPGANEDFGLEQVTGDPGDRYAFRTMPLRNVALQATFTHNGAFVRLEDVIRHHLDAYTSARTYSPGELAPDLRNLGPMEPVLANLDPRIANPPVLDEGELSNLVAFVCTGLLDRDARPNRFMHLIPRRVPSGLPVHRFEPAVLGDPCLDGG